MNGMKLPEYNFTDLDYADDVALLDESTSKLQHPLNISSWRLFSPTYIMAKKQTAEPR